MLRRIFWPFLLLPALLAPVQAAVDLVTLPTREGTQLTIYNSEDITMVREHRLLTVKEGVNHIQFSYSVTYKRRKVGPELNTEKKREPL